MATYLPRVADTELRRRMDSFGGVLIEGPKASGKTATATQVAQTVIRLDVDANARASLSLNAAALFEQPLPILFDEWQVEPAIWNQVRRFIDDKGGRGLVVLTGSATPKDDANRHSGAGRISTMIMRPMSLFESGHSNGSASLAAMFEGESPTATGTPLSVPELMERIVVGGWPSLLDASERQARTWIADYLGSIAEVDVPSLGPRRNPQAVMRLFEALARSVGQPVKLTNLAADVGGERGPIAPQTLNGYLDALARLRIGDDSAAWRPHMRSTTRLREAPVRYFVDPSLGTGALRVGVSDLLKDLNAAGFHFEALVLRDLRIHSQSMGGIVDSWRDANGREVDAVIRLDDGRWAAIEVKLNPEAVDAAATSLRRFADAVDTQRSGPPSFLGVVTTGTVGGTRPDGVHVIPISALGP